MSKKGAFIYQQIELTTAEWATDTTVYPASVWLFERLATGKFNMKLADGVRPFSQLGTVMQDVTVTVKTNNAATYVLTITTAAGAFDTPNLKPAVYTHPTFPARSAGLYKITVNAEGHVTDVVAVTKADITTLGIPAQDTNTTYSPATAAVDGLMSKTDKSKLDGVATSANNYTHPAYAAKASGLYKITVDATGHISAVTAATKADITALGIPAQDTNTTYSPATTAVDGLMSKTDKTKLDGVAASANNYTHPAGAGNNHIPAGGAAGQFLKWSAAGIAVWAADNNTTYAVATATANGLMSSEDKGRLDFFAGCNNVTTLVGLPVTKRTINATLSAATNLSLNGSLAEGFELLIRCIPSAAFTQPIPNTGAWISMSGVSFATTANKPFEISIWCYKAGYYSVVVKDQD